MARPVSCVNCDTESAEELQIQGLSVALNENEQQIRVRETLREAKTVSSRGSFCCEVRILDNMK